MADFPEASRDATALFSTEGLSLLRFPEELDRLGRLFNPQRHRVTMVCVPRNPRDFPAACRRQILKFPGRRPSSDRRSSLYGEPDWWLADYDGPVSAYARVFGREAIKIVDYDGELRRSGDVGPAVLRAIGLPDHFLPPPGAIGRANTSSLTNTVRQRVVALRTLLRRRGGH